MALEGGIENRAVLDSEGAFHYGLEHRLRPVFAQEADAAEIDAQDGKADVRHYMGGRQEGAVPAHRQDKVSFRTDVRLCMDGIYLVRCGFQVFQKLEHTGLSVEFVVEDEITYFHIIIQKGLQNYNFIYNFHYFCEP